MRKIAAFVLTLTVFASCQSSKQETQTQTDSTGTDTPIASMITASNQLTDEQKAEGWTLLFNGENTNGWRFFKNKENDTWEVLNGTLHCKSDSLAKKRSDIMTNDQYENFELSFDWKVAPKSNSGVMFRVTEENERPYLSGPEYQLIDDLGYPSKLTDTQTTGSNYDMHAAPADKPVKPVGEWNNSRIVVNGNHVEHWLNGSKLLEYEIGSDDWKTRKAGSKWKNAAGYGVAKKGHIDFQDHGDEAWFRNIMVKAL
jgi:hypothetical protein